MEEVNGVYKFSLGHVKQNNTLSIKSFEKNYQVISSLGNGSFGSVQLAKYRKNVSNLTRPEFWKEGTLIEPLEDSKEHASSLVAIKTMKKKLQLLTDYNRVKELKFILSMPSHPCLVQIYDVFVDKTGFQLHIVMETMDHNLYQLMRARNRVRFSSSTLKSILKQLLGALQHIHKHDYFHRDVKPENVLVMPTLQYYGSKENIPPERRNQNYVIKLADYGLARYVGNTNKYTSYVSTRWYRSPEILLRRRWYSKPVDIWAFGTIAVEVANFIPLFPGANEMDQIWRILEILGCPVLPSLNSAPQRGAHVPLGGYWKEAQLLASRLGFSLPYTEGVLVYSLLPDSISPDLADVIKACLTWNPDVRIDVDTLLSMPYFQESVSGPSVKESETMSNKKLLHSLREVSMNKISQGNKKGLQEQIKTNSCILKETENVSSPAKTRPKRKLSPKAAPNQYYAPSDFSHKMVPDLPFRSTPESKGKPCRNDEKYNFDPSPEREEIVFQELNHTPSDLAEENESECVNFYDVDDNSYNGEVIIADEIDDSYTKNCSDYLWEGCEKYNVKSSIPTNNKFFSNQVKAINGPIDDEFGLSGDISFGSSHGIKC